MKKVGLISIYENRKLCLVELELEVDLTGEKIDSVGKMSIIFCLFN